MGSLDTPAAIIGLITVVAASFLYLSGLQPILDPMMSMDPLYIRLAQGSVADIFSQDPAWGPLYAVWLKPLAGLFDDPVRVYAANIYALSLGVSIAIYLHILSLTRRAVPAVGASLLFIVSDFNVPLSSKVSEFALVVVLVGLTLSQLVATRSRRMSIAAIGVLLASYARPELYPAALSLAAAALWLAYRDYGDSGGGSLVFPLLLLASVVLPAVTIGTPIFGDDRFLIAFREHFAWNWTSWHGTGETFLSIWSREFGEAESILQAALHNPSAVARHLIDNLFGTLGFMVTSTFAHYPFLAPADQAVLVKAEGWLLSAAALGVLVYVAATKEGRRRVCGRYGQVLLVYAVISLFPLGAATVVFPAAHYLVIPSVLLMATAALAFAEVVPNRFEPAWPTRIGAALVCLMAIPKPFVLPTAYQVPGSRFVGRITVERRVTDTIEQIRSLGLVPPVNVLTTTDGVGEMLGTGFQEIKVWQKGSEPLGTFLRDNDVGVIINLEGGRVSFMIDDPLWTTIHDNPGEAGFVRVPVPHHEAVRVYVRSDLMQR